MLLEQTTTISINFEILKLEKKISAQTILPLLGIMKIITKVLFFPAKVHWLLANRTTSGQFEL